jgi:hypothetical protein
METIEAVEMEGQGNQYKKIEIRFGRHFSVEIRDDQGRLSIYLQADDEGLRMDMKDFRLWLEEGMDRHPDLLSNPIKSDHL